MTTGPVGTFKEHFFRHPPETFDGLPPEVWQVHQLQQKTSWSKQDHDRMMRMTKRWTDAHRRRYEEQWNWGRPARWL